MGKTNDLRNRISSFQQQADVSIPEVRECLQEYILVCPHHGMEDWLLIQNFYPRLINMAHDHIDVFVGGALFLVNVNEAKNLTEKMVPI